MPIDFDAMKKNQAKPTYPRRGKPPLIKKKEEKKEVSPPSPTVQSQPLTEEDMVAKRKLIKQLFDENEELPIEDMLLEYLKFPGENMANKKGTTTANRSPFKGIKQGLEDMLSIQQLNEILHGFRDMKKNNNKNDNQQQNNNSSTNNFSTLLPFLMKMQNGGMDGTQLDPTMLLLAMGMGGQGGGGSGGGNDLGQLFFMMSMANMLNNQGNQQKQQGQQGQQNQPSLNADMMKALWEELQTVMNKQNQQNQKPAIDPVTLLMLQTINKSSQGQSMKTDNTVEVLLDKFNTMMQNNQTQNMAMIMQQSNDRFERGMEMIAGALNRERPEEKLMKNFELFRNITGDTRAKTETEMDYGLRKDEMVMREQSRQDMLNREERQIDREDKKSARILDIGGIVLDKIVGNGLGNLVQDVMSAKTTTPKRRGRKEPQQNEGFDPSLLDDL